MGYWKEGKGYRVFCGIDDSGKPIRKRASTLEEAKRILATFQKKKGRYDADLLALPEKAKIEVYHVLMRCIELGVSLSELLDFYCDSKGKSADSKTCKECVDLYLKNMEEANRRPASIYSMRWFLQKFFYTDTPIKALTFEMIKAKFDSRPLKSKSTFRRECSAFLNFCVRHKFCDFNHAINLTLPAVEKARPHILTIDQAKKLLKETSGEVLTYIVICMFCGLRPTEYKRLKKSDIDLNKATISISSDMAKTRSFRIVKIPDVALQWLKKYGVTLPKFKTARPALVAREIIGLKTWPLDILRHTAASMMLARDQNADAVALQLGNSPAILHRHYKNLVTEQEASEFWSLFPEKLTKTNLELTKTC